MDQVLEIDSTSVLSQVSEATVTDWKKTHKNIQDGDFRKTLKTDGTGPKLVTTAVFNGPTGAGTWKSLN